MKHTKYEYGFFILFICLMVFGAVMSADKSETVERKIKTVYGLDGLAVSELEHAQGLHEVWGTGKLTGGVDTIEINTSIDNGAQDVSFTGDSTYFGQARALSVNGNTYIVVPISGSKFVVVSSDTTDTAAFRFKLEGH